MRYLKKMVTYCVGFSTCVVVCALGICLWRGYDPSAIVSSALMFFGGELCLSCLTRIFAKEDRKKNGNLGNVDPAGDDGSDRGD